MENHENHPLCKVWGRCDRFHEAGKVVDGVCTPLMTEEMREWRDRRDNGKPVGRAPAWNCNFYDGNEPC